MSGYIQKIKQAVKKFFEQIKENQTLLSRSSLTLKSVSELYIHSISRYVSNIKDIKNIKITLIELGNKLIKNFELSGKRIYEFSLQIIKNNDKILIKGYSTLVKNVILQCHNNGLRLEIFILESRPNCEGYMMYEQLREAGVKCNILVDSAMGFIMEEIDYVLTGAELVTESGGIINRVGTYSLALCANSLEKPFYVLAENYKFSRIFPLGQRDLDNDVLQGKDFILCNPDDSIKNLKDLNYISPYCDFTPQNFISFIISDSRIFQPSSISDEMLQLFNL